MNERIEKLAEQAVLQAIEVFDQNGKDYQRIVLEKFAKLIVKECADAADMAQDAGCEYAGDYVAEYMGFSEQEGVTEWRAE